MTQEVFEHKQKQMSDKELLELIEKQIVELAKTGGKSHRMCVPPSIKDTDMLFTELARRYKECIELKETSITHFEYVHKFLIELHKKFPTKKEIRHNITVNKDNQKLVISIYSKNGWDAVEMDKYYEGNSTYSELVKGIFDII